MTDVTVTAASDIEIDREALDASIAEFTGSNSGYYAAAFHKIHESSGAVPLTFNLAAAVLGPVWAAMRGVWGFFWGFLLLEMIAWVQIGRGAWGDLGADIFERAERQRERAAGFLERADQARQAGEDPARFETLAANLTKAAENSQVAADAAQAEALSILIVGLVLLLLLKLFQGVWSNIVYEKQYSRWRIDPDHVESGLKPRNLILGIVLVLTIAPLTVYKFTISGTPDFLNSFPADKDHYVNTANWLEGHIDAAALGGAGAFDSIVAAVRAVLDALTIALIGTPWPVVMAVICVVAWRAAGPRVAIFTAGALAYIAFLGYWEISMETVALVGAAVIICVSFGIPFGIWFGKSKRAYKFAEPVLDLMQTLPAFVYLIPIIAFFGTGNPPGILATIIFGMPPVIRLTALGMRGVPENIKEAATAFGATRWQLLRDVEVPLALPSIMAGVNQTILMCLSMVVIISLIGGGGLGKVILEALQYAAKGPGLLGGFAILFCAMVIDRIVQGGFRRADQK
ncbi:ABC transporter permease subunit [Pelagibius litoralis]|uniref:ABC transporter permease subunit n=1 Tax=Pelagibius litoralis TaxID=374515 RepID=A0A967EXQ3_9PROT|nr:ABC transporter permease subunit [Pelagibius litoralis]NIA69338.1 ABC transporter permease subunit [Pelagibius litoralis]